MEKTTRPSFWNVTRPAVRCSFSAYEVMLVGAGVDPGWIGRRLVARTRERGGYADRALVSVEDLIPVPDGLGLREAAALLHDGPTALALFDNAEVKPQEWVLVLGAALGLLLVQLARAAGARVIGAARGGRKLDPVREMGAEVAIDYSEPNWVEQVRKATGGAGFDVVFDGAGGTVGEAAFALMGARRGFSAHGAPGGGFADIDPQAARRLGVTVRGIEQAKFAPAECR